MWRYVEAVPFEAAFKLSIGVTKDVPDMSYICIRRDICMDCGVLWPGAVNRCCFSRLHHPFLEHDGTTVQHFLACTIHEIQIPWLPLQCVSRYGWWESVVMLRKLSIALLVVFLHVISKEGLQLLVSVVFFRHALSTNVAQVSTKSLSSKLSLSLQWNHWCWWCQTHFRRQAPNTDKGVCITLTF